MQRLFQLSLLCVALLAPPSLAPLAFAEPDSVSSSNEAQSFYSLSVASLKAQQWAARFKVSDERHLPRLYLHGKSTPYVVVITHGAFDSPHYLNGLAEAFHQRGYNVVSPLLPKHWAKPLDRLNDASYIEWIAHYRATLKLARGLGKRVILAGHSLGGLLALDAYIDDPDTIAGLFLWAPAVELTYATYFASWAGILAKPWLKLDYNYLARKPPPDPKYVAYYSPFAGREVNRLSQTFRKKLLEKLGMPSGSKGADPYIAFQSIKVPIFLATAYWDLVVSNNAGERLFSEASGPKKHLVYWQEDHSSLTKGPGDFVEGVQGENESFPEMVREMHSFLDEHF